MPKSKLRYAITQHDFYLARAYLQRQLKLNPYWIEPDEATTSLAQCDRDAITLSQWCERWLTPKQWQQLRAAVRAKHYRLRQQVSHDGSDVHVRLKRKAWWILSDLAKHHGVTLSDFIVRKHHEAWLDLDDPPQPSNAGDIDNH